VLPEGFFTGQAGAIVVNRDLGVTLLNGVIDGTFCRTEMSDFYSWLLPTLMFDAAGIDLTGANVTLVDYPDTEAVLDAVAAGECTMAGVAQTVVDAGLPDGVTLAQTSVEFPLHVLVYPSTLDGGIRDTLNTTLIAIATDPQTNGLIAPLVHATNDSGEAPARVALLPMTAEDFADLEAFIAAAGLDFAVLGQ
jgi:hypothetical protein